MRFLTRRQPDILVEKHVSLSRCHLFAPLKVGYRSYANDSLIRNAEIGRYCSIGRRVSIGAIRHRTDLMSTHPVFGGGDDAPRTTIGHDVYIGDNAVVMCGLTIGTGAVIGAGAIVTKDVEPYAIVAGVPARKIKDRFDADRKAELLASEWWNFDYPSEPDQFVPPHHEPRRVPFRSGSAS